MPRPVIEKLAAEFADALRVPKIQDLLKAAYAPEGRQLVGGVRRIRQSRSWDKVARANAQRVLKAMGIRPGDAP